MLKKLFFILLVLSTFTLLSGCDPESVEVEVTRVVEVTREVEIFIPIEATAAPEEAAEPAVNITPVLKAESGEESNPEPVTESESDSQALPNILRIPHSLIWSGDESLDPYAPTRFSEYSLLAYERLIRLDSSGNLVPGLATAWEPNSDATVWTLTLRDGVQFHNGALMGPADVAYSLERMIDPSTDSTLAPVFQSIAAVAPARDNQVTIGLSAPNIEFPLLLTDPRAVILRNNGGDNIYTDGIGTGPYKLKNLDLMGITELAAFNQYWGGQPGVDEVMIVSIPDAESQIQAMQAGQIDILNQVVPEQKSLFEGSNEFSLQSIPTGDWRGFVMRTDTAPFDDPAVRKALRIVADRQAIIDAVLSGTGTVACDHPVWQGDRYWTEVSCRQDVELAKSLLADAGYPDGISVDLHTSQLDPYWPAMITIYQEQAAAAGITINVIGKPVETFWTDTWLIDPFISTSWNERPAPLILNEAWRSTAAWNETYWQNDAFDALLDQAAAELDLATRKDQYAQLQNTLWESGGAFIPFHLNRTRIVSTCIAGVQPIAAEHVDFSLIVKTPNCN